MTGKSNVEDKIDDQSYSKGEDSKNARSEIEDQLNSESKPEAHDNVVLENKPPTIDAGTDDMVSGYAKVIDDEVQNFEKMIYEANQNGNDLMVDRQEESQMKTIPTNVTTDSSIGKTPEPASPIFPSTANAGQHSGEASENICAMEHTLIHHKLWRSVIRLGGYDQRILVTSPKCPQLIRSSGSTIKCNKLFLD
ncbi:hypothetical protein KY285_010565 [Solanum tuberosum]|nr:hypothetical protein KY289_011110 [Solanum tuberosum]KAH0734858.1 hypothetical protein KY285_010565 [Solanum tuberosum]